MKKLTFLIFLLSSVFIHSAALKSETIETISNNTDLDISINQWYLDNFPEPDFELRDYIIEEIKKVNSNKIVHCNPLIFKSILRFLPHIRRTIVTRYLEIKLLYLRTLKECVDQNQTKSIKQLDTHNDLTIFKLQEIEKKLCSLKKSLPKPAISTIDKVDRIILKLVIEKLKSTNESNQVKVFFDSLINAYQKINNYLSTKGILESDNLLINEKFIILKSKM